MPKECVEFARKKFEEDRAAFMKEEERWAEKKKEQGKWFLR